MPRWQGIGSLESTDGLARLGFPFIGLGIMIWVVMVLKWLAVYGAVQMVMESIAAYGTVERVLQSIVAYGNLHFAGVGEGLSGLATHVP